MKFSIVTISFNQAEYLERTILSVLKQRDDVEMQYIVMDPGSDDGSRDIIEKYRDDIDIIDYSVDKGPADGLRKGFKYADGMIYGYINSDDVLFPGALKIIENFFNQQGHACDVVSGGAYLIDSNDEYLRKLYSDRFCLNAAAYGESILIQPSSFFKKEAYGLSNGFNANNKTNWDGELFIDMAIKNVRFKNINCILSGYRVHDESITGTKSTESKMIEYNKLIFEKITGNDYSSYSKVAKFYYYFKRKFNNYPDTFQRLVGGKSFGRSI